jgi:tail assembly chaperone
MPARRPGLRSERVRWDKLVIAAIEVGLSPSQFWEATARELALYAGARAHQAEDDLRRQLFLAWHVAALVRTDKLPPLDELLPPAAAAAKESAEQELGRRAREHEQIVASMFRK